MFSIVLQILSIINVVLVSNYYARWSKGDKVDVIKVFEEAIQAEIEAQEMYKRDAEMAEDPETRNMFEQLLRWEIGHEQLLRDKLNTLKLLKEL